MFTHDSKLRRRLLAKFPNRVLPVELTNICNLSCPLCSTGSGVNKKPKGTMIFENFRKVIDECAFLVDTVSLLGSGEPFLHPECLRFVHYVAKEKRKEVTCCSNGMMLPDPEEIVKSGLHEINIDIDGITQDQHEKYRVGADLNKILSNSERLVQAKKKLRSYFPRIYFDVIVSKYNENDYGRFIELTKKTKVDGIKFRGILDEIHKTEDWFPGRKEFRPVSKQGCRYDCSFKNDWAGILSWDGDVQLCCMSPNHVDPLIKFNAFKADNLLETLDSNEFYDLTKLAGELDFCKTCSFSSYDFYRNSIEFGSFFNYSVMKCFSRKVWTKCRTQICKFIAR